MKYLLWFLIVLLGIWWLRKQRQPQAPTHTPQPPAANAQPTAMLPCTHCGVLCPENDMTTGQRGRYCSDAHRQSHEG